MKKINKILIQSASRAEFYIQKNLINKLSNHFSITLLIHGDTIKKIDKKEILKSFGKNIKIIISKTNYSQSNNPTFVSASFTKQVYFISKNITKFKPDISMIFGDRTDALALAVSSLIHKVPVVHLHGGEVTLGSIDEKIRHSISKISDIHFVSHNNYKKRLIQLGEINKNIKNFGSLELDRIDKQKFKSKRELKKKLKLKDENYVLISINSEINSQQSKMITKNILKALEFNKDYVKIITMPNSDPFSDEVSQEILHYKKKPNFQIFNSLNRYYTDVLKNAKFVIGNSSSIVYVAPFLGVPSILVGDRQKGRILSKSIIKTGYNLKQIVSSIKKIKGKTNRCKIYFKKDTMGLITNYLKKINLENFKYKRFIDLKI